MSSSWRDRSSNQKRANAWFKHNPNAKKKAHSLSVGLRGILCTCNGKLQERECVRDSYNILNEYADKILGQEVTEIPPNTGQDDEPDDGDTDADLTKEIASLKEAAKPNAQRRFQSTESGATGVIFIKTTIPDPATLVHQIVSDIAEKKLQKSKFLLRMLPVEATCKANLPDINKTCAELFKNYFSEGDKTFAILFNHRNNDSLSRNDVIESLALQVMAVNAGNSVDLKSPQLTIIVEIIRGICCLAVVKDYYQLKKYNILEASGEAKRNVKEDVDPVEVQSEAIEDTEADPGN